MKKSISVVLLAIIMIINLSGISFAKEDTEILLDSVTVKISNVISEQDCEIDGYWEPHKLFTAIAPVKVTFATDTGRQSISTSDGWVVTEDGTLSMDYDKPEWLIMPDFIQYRIWNEKGEKITVDSLPEDYEDEYLYAAGSYTTLTEPGVYMVYTSGLATAGDVCIIKVVDKTPSSTPVKTSAIPTSAKIKVDGKEVTLQGYNINNNNFFKLRDLAMVLNGTNKPFEVAWDTKSNAISILSGLPYTATGGELATITNPVPQEAVPTNSNIYIDGESASFTAYNINNSNYFKLRDIGKALDFGVTWNSGTSTIDIVTSTGYSE